MTRPRRPKASRADALVISNAEKWRFEIVFGHASELGSTSIASSLRLNSTVIFSLRKEDSLLDHAGLTPSSLETEGQ